MDNRRLFLAIAVSLAILLGFQYLLPRHNPAQQRQIAATQTKDSPSGPNPVSSPLGSTPVAQVPPAPLPADVPRLPIEAPRVQGSIDLLGARLDELVLRDYRETVSKDSPLESLLRPVSDPRPYYVQFGWSAAPGSAVALPDLDRTVWHAEDGGALTPAHPVTLSWDNGQGVTFLIHLAVDQDYMFTVRQEVRNASGAPVSVFPWTRLRRDYTPPTQGYYILHEGFVGVLGGRLQELTYAKSKTEAKDKPAGSPTTTPATAAGRASPTSTG